MHVTVFFPGVRNGNFKKSVFEMSIALPFFVTFPVMPSIISTSPAAQSLNVTPAIVNEPPEPTVAVILYGVSGTVEKHIMFGVCAFTISPR